MNNINNHNVNNRRIKIFNITPAQSIGSLKNYATIFFIAALLFLGAFIYKFCMLNPDVNQHFNLPISQIDLLPLYSSNYAGFLSIGIYEALRITCLAGLFFYFAKFIKSLDIAEPFKNLNSKKHLSKVLLCSMVFFVIDAIGTMHLNYLMEHLHIRLFHFEYLFMVYFLNVFAVIFNRGIDLNNEIDLVI